jgi:hypothetical protein
MSEISIGRFFDPEIVDIVQKPKFPWLPSGDDIDAIDPLKDEEEFKLAATASAGYSLIRNGLKYFSMPKELMRLAGRIPMTNDQYRMPYNPLVVGVEGSVRAYSLLLCKKTIVMLDWRTEEPYHGVGFLRFLGEPLDPCESDEKLHRAIGLMMRTVTLCYHAGQLLEKLPPNGKSRRQRAINQNRQIKMVQTVDWLRENYLKEETPATGRTVAPHERRAHSRCIGGRLVDVKAAVIHKDRYQKPVTTIIK